MRRRALLLLAAALLATALPTACGAGLRRAGAPPPRLRILTWNIHHGADAAEHDNLDAVAAWIRRLRPDVVLLQEVDRETTRSRGVDQAAVLGARTGMQAFFGKAMDYAGGGYGEAALTRLPVVTVLEHPLPQREGSEPRTALELRVRLAGGQVVAVVGTHLDHQEDPADRRVQAARLAEVLSAPGRPPTALAGDLNAALDASELAPLAGLLADAAAGDPRPTWPADAPRLRLDHVLVLPTAAWRVVEARVVSEAAAPSDHLPVLVVLELRTSG